VLAKLDNLNSIIKYELTGELRRGIELISVINILVLITSRKKFINEIERHFNCEVLPEKILIKNHFEIPVILNITENNNSFIKDLFLTTGSEEFIRNMDFSFKNNYKSEFELFQKNNAPYIIPEMREEIYFKIKNKKIKKNSNLTVDNFNGLLHFHTSNSDGKNTLNEMIIAAKEYGFKYAVVCDHSRSAYYANCLNERDILLQKKKVRESNAKNNLYLFHGIESDILFDGDLDYPEDILKEFDMIVASVHSRFNMNESEMTKRMIKAIENPLTDILGHPSGRMLLKRDPYKFDVRKIIDACSLNDVAIEINSNPRRLDLDWRWVYYAREKGCKFAINPDAHNTREISFIYYGIKIGRKAGLQKSEAINYFSLANFKKYLNRKVKRTFEH